MTITVKHTKVSAVADSADTSLVRPSDWNADHTLVGLGTAAELDAGVANGAATLDSSGKVPISQIPQMGDLNYQGTWNASTNTPALASSTGTKGYYYVVSVAGTTNLNGITDWKIGDWAVFNGTAWEKIDNTDSVTSVNGYTGAVVLVNTDISGFGTMSTQNANNVAITGGTVALSASTTSLIPLHMNTGVQPTTPIQGDIWAEATGVYYHNSAYTNQLNLGANSAGTLSEPAITVTGSGSTVDVGSVKAVLFSLPGWLGDYKEYVIPAATGLALTDNSANYVVVNYNAGSPVYQVITNPALITNSDIVGACLLWRAGTEVHFQAINWGLSTASRTNRRLVQTNRYQRASGLALGESTGRIITLSAGNVWYGVTEIIEGAVTSASNNADFYYHVAGVWTKTTLSTYNNLQYDNGTALQTLGGGKYAVNWVYRYLDGAGLPKLAYLMGGGDYSLAQAQTSASPTPPPILSTMAILVGRIIVQKSAVTAAQIDSAFTITFSSTTVTDHNDLANLQGGTTNEYYHLTSAAYTIANQAASSTLNGYLTSTDWTTFNTKLTSVTADAPLTGAGTSASHLSIPAATSSVNGYLTSTDWTTFNSKASSFTYTTNYIPYGQGTTTPLQSSSFTYTPATGEVKAPEVVATNGLIVNNATVSASYTVATGTNAMSVGPITVASGQTVTVTSGQRWVVL